ncbi:MAG: alpha/beta hydrolase, partial [Sphingomonas sp.]
MTDAPPPSSSAAPAPRPRSRLAYHHRRGSEPTIVFLPGYASDMQGTKALALEA